MEDLVYVNSRPYKQLNIALNKNIKLNPCFYGPCKTIQRVGWWLMRVFGSVVAVAFQIAFRDEKHANNVFLFFKNYF